MFSVVSDPINTLQKLSKDLDKVGLWANKWKMSFSPDPSKQAQEVIFFTEDNQNVSIINSKAFSDKLEEELTFKHHINEKIKPIRVLLLLFIYLKLTKS